MPFRETLVLRDVQGLDYREIAEVTKVPIGTVMSRLARARRRLIASIGRTSQRTGHDNCDAGRPDPARSRLSRRRARPRRMRSRSNGALPPIRRWRPSASGSRRCGRVIGRTLPRETPPPGLARRIEAAVGLQGAAPRPSAHPSWRALAASVVLGILSRAARPGLCCAPAGRDGGDGRGRVTCAP